MRYWDSSAVVALLLEEPKSRGVRALLENNTAIISWWGTPVECLSAFWRRKREGCFQGDEFKLLQERFDRFVENVDFVEPTIMLKERAFRLLPFHSLRAGDLLQLASALHWAQEKTRGVDFVCLDGRLREAARAEGFTILP